MIIADHEDALICDFAEYYGIYNYKSLPVRYLATLATGLRADSRVKGELMGVEQPPVGIMLVRVYDVINKLAWSIAGDGDMPADAINVFLTGEKTEDGYQNGEDFEQARRAILARVKEKRTNGK